MGAIAVALGIGLLALGLIGLIVVGSTLALGGLKVLNAAHNWGTWLVNHMQSRRSRRNGGPNVHQVLR